MCSLAQDVAHKRVNMFRLIKTEKLFGVVENSTTDFIKCCMKGHMPNT